MTLDIRTLALLLFVVSTFHSFAVFLLYRMNKGYNGLGWLTLGGAAITLAFPCLLMRLLPIVGGVAIVMGNLLFVGGMALFYVGVMRFFDRRERSNLLVAYCALITLIAAYFTFVDDNLQARLVNFSLGLGALSLAVGRLFIVLRTPELAKPTRLLCAAFLFYGAFFLLRGIVVLFYAPIKDFFEPNWANTLSYFVPLFVGMVWYLGFIFLVHQRVLNEHRTAKDNLELIFNTSPDSVILSRLSDGLCVGVNDAFATLTGFSREETLGASMLSLSIWRDANQRERLVERLREHGVLENEEVVFHRKDGELRTGIASAKVFQFQGEPHAISVTRDITERKRMEEALRLSEEKWRTLVNTSPDGVCIASLDLRIQQVNNKGITMFGYDSLDQIVGRSLYNFLHPDSHEKAKLFFKELLQGNNVGPVEYLVLRRDGGSFFIEANAELLLDSTGNPTGIFFIERDLTERKRAEELREEIERILRHDLRSPAGSAVSVAKLLSQAPELSPEYKKLAQVLQQEGQQMLDTLNFSLDLYKIETGQYSYQPQATDATLIIRQVSEALLLQRQHEGKRIEITLGGRPVAPGYACMVQAAPFLLRTALQNLIQNALESTPSGGLVHIAVSCGQGDEYGARIEIRNVGAVPRDIRPRFFEKYMTSGKPKGTGLGVYSAKKAIEAQHGAITMRTSDQDNETVVTVILAE
jgi:PAS domain S-box-containing protein